MNKKEELKVAFKNILTKMSERIIEHLEPENQVIVDITTNKLMEEVKKIEEVK